MNLDGNVIYRLDDSISFRKCTLFDGKNSAHGDCTNFDEKEENWRTYYYCNQHGIHLHCTKHSEIELDVVDVDYPTTLKCPKCNEELIIDSFKGTVRKCLKMLNMEIFKDAKLVRLDDWYTPEVKEKIKTTSDYWIKTDVKTDKDGDTIVVVYVGHVGSKEKAQFFIKPEKCQLTSDHKDLDPTQILSKIEITLRDRILSHRYD